MESKKINQLATELTPALDYLTIIGDPTTGISKKITLSQMASLFTGTVEEYANFAAFPLVGVADTIYIALDTNVLYRWNTGTNAYVELSPNIINSLVFSDANGFDGNISLVGSVATLTITTALTTGSVPFIGASGALSQDNANLFFDDINNRLGINTNAPTTALDVFGSGIIGRLNGTSTNNSFLGFASAGTNKWSIGNVQSDHRFRIYSEANTAELVSVLQTGEFGIGIANPTTKLHIDGGASALIANLDANVSVAKSLSFRSDNSNRINLEVSGTESGSNAGADFFIRRYSDAGALIDTPLTITRSTGALTIPNTVSFGAGAPTAISGTDGTLIIPKIRLYNGTPASVYHDIVSGASTNKSVTIPDITGTMALLEGTQTFSGAKTFSSALNGTSATFSGNVNLTGAATTIQLQGTSYGNIAADKDLYIDAGGSSAMYLRTNGGSTRLTIASSGTTTIAGTFVQSPSSGSGGFYIDRGTSTQSPYISWFNGSGTRLGYMGYSNTNIGLYLENSANFVVTGGSVGIGTSSPKSLLSVAGNINGFVDGTFAHQHYRAASDSFTATTINSVINGAAAYLTFGTNTNWTNGNATERMRIDSAGEVKITGAGDSNTAFSIYDTTARRVFCIPSQYYGYIFAVSVASNGGKAISIGNAGGASEVGSIVANASSTTYNTTSDYRLKEDLKDFDGLDILSKIKFYDFKWKSEDARTTGVIAHELQEVVPYAVNGEKDGIGIEGDPSYQGVDYSKLVSIQGRAIQQLQAQIEELKALINK